MPQQASELIAEQEAIKIKLSLPAVAQRSQEACGCGKPADQLSLATTTGWWIWAVPEQELLELVGAMSSAELHLLEATRNLLDQLIPGPPRAWPDAERSGADGCPDRLELPASPQRAAARPRQGHRQGPGNGSAARHRTTTAPACSRACGWKCCSITGGTGGGSGDNTTTSSNPSRPASSCRCSSCCSSPTIRGTRPQSNACTCRITGTADGLQPCAGTQHQPARTVAADPGQP